MLRRQAFVLVELYCCYYDNQALPEGMMVDYVKQFAKVNTRLLTLMRVK